jgi:rfaE bifunctional protein nucleotidyltransferase chain/domain
MRARDKIVGRRAARALIADAQQGGRCVVFTSGCFDLLHIGHLRSFEQARALGDLLIVGVNRDRRVRELKGPDRPLVYERHRAEMVAGLSPVGCVVLFGEDTPAPLIRHLRPNIVCKGSEYRGEDTEEGRAIRALGGRYVLLPETPGTRTSHVVAKMARPPRPPEKP